MAVPAAALSVAIKPKQNLHGYAFPWPGGAGKNKLPPPLTVTKTPSSAVTVTNKDGYLTLNGAVASGEKVTVTFDNTVVPSDAQIALMNSSALATANISFHNGGTQYDYFTLSTANRVLDTSSLNLLIGQTINKYEINFTANATLNDFTIGLMLLHTGSDNTTFEPYSNICPISGISSIAITSVNDDDTADVTIAFGQTVYAGTINFKTGELTIDGAYLTENDFIGLADNTSAGGLHYAVTDQLGNFDTSKDVILSMLQYVRSGAWQSTTPISSYGTKDIRVYCTEASLAEFKTAYAGLQIVYPLVTPITVSLTPDILTMLKGDNSLSADSGDVITVTAYAINEEVGA